MVVMGAVFTWIIKKEESFIRSEITKKAEALTKQLEIIRGFIADKQDVINTDLDTGNVTFKGLNPARVGAAISKEFTKTTNFVMKQTSLEYRNPENAPDEFEVRMLKQFKTTRDKEPTWREDFDKEGNKTIRYILPLYIKEECLPCHGKPEYEGEVDITGYKKEGYEAGELRGAISIAAPASHLDSIIKTNSIILLIIGVVSTISVIFLTYLLIRKFIRVPLSHTVAATKAIAEGDLTRRVDIRSRDEFGELAESFNIMAESVAQKTKELAWANETIALQNQQIDELKKKVGNRE